METFLYSEWRIENFTFWRSDAHRRRIGSEKRGRYRYELYPKGPNGQEDRMALHISDIGDCSSLRELHFIGPDGSLICKLPMNLKKGENVQIHNGPRYDDVISLIRKRKAQHGDRLTLLIRSNEKKEKIYMFTEIEVVDTSFKVDIAELAYSTATINLNQDCSLTVYLETTGEKGKNQLAYFSISLSRSSGGVSVLTRASLISSDGSLSRFGENEHSFGSSWESYKLPYLLTESELIEEEIASLLLRVQIITGCTLGRDREISIFSESLSLVPNHIVCSEKKPLKSLGAVSIERTKTPPSDVLSKDLMWLYQDQDFSDFQLKCGDVTFPVHKVILSARSPVFKTMLSCDMTETASGQVVVEDLDPSTLSLFLTYLYTGAVEHLQCDRALKLYYAADKYQVPSLKGVCADFISANISIDHFIDILSTANKHQDDQLTTLAHNFISNNYREVMRSEEWKRFMDVEPLIVAKTLTHLAERNFVSSLSSD